MEWFPHLEAVLKLMVDEVEGGEQFKLLHTSVKWCKCNLFETFCSVAAIRVINNVETIHKPVEDRLRHNKDEAGGLSLGNREFS